jgi:hypothetical protein
MMSFIGRLIAVAIATAPAVAGAQLQYVEPVFGTGGGLGAVPTVLTFHKAHVGNDESGCITPTGRTGCGFLDSRMQHHSQVQPLATAPLRGIDGSTLRVIGNFAEPGGGSITVENLVLTLFDGKTAVFSTANFLSPLTFGTTRPGVGQYGFAFALSPSDAALFDSFIDADPDGAWSIGLGASLSDAQGGLDTFFLARVTALTVTPEPASILLLATGLLLLGLVKIGQRTERRSTY